MPRASRAKIQACIKAGNVYINGGPETKASRVVKPGDQVICELPAPLPLEAAPEDIAIDIVYEDQYLLVVNKPPHLVVHPSAGHWTGTLVNALLHHCKLPPMQIPLGSLPPKGLMGSESKEAMDGSVEEDEDGTLPPLTPSPGLYGEAQIVRPGIVHRLDKGTSGLLVVAKDEWTHMRLCDQFKARTVRRAYVAIVCGIPNPPAGRVEASIGRDPRDRKKMTVVEGFSRGGPSRYAASRYQVVEVVAGGGASLVEWRLETGRTHQIRVHAQHLKHCVLGDEAYGGMGGGAVAALTRHLGVGGHGKVKHLMAGLERPCLHAQTLGFVHPHTEKEMYFAADTPDDFLRILSELRTLGEEHVV